MFLRLAVILGLILLAAWWRRRTSQPIEPPRINATDGVMVLLGAGFSQTLGIACTAKIGHEIDDALARGRCAAVYIPLRDRLIARFQTAYNFEVLMAALEACIVYGRPGFLPGSPEYRSVIPEIATMRPDITAHAAAQMYEIAMEIIAREVGMDWRSTATSKDRYRLRTFFDALRSRWRLSVATLNYDDGAEEFIPDAVDGFVGKGDLQAFDSRAFLADDSRPRIAHVHGSLAFGITELSKQFVKNVGPPRTRREMMWTERLDGIIWSAVVTGAEKPNKLVLQPYSIYYAWLTNEMLRTPRTVIVGYGMGDLHINAWLVNVALHHDGPDYRLVIIDKFTRDTLPEHLTDIFAMAAGYANRVDAGSALSALRFEDDVATHGSAMIIRSGLPLTDRQLNRMLLFLA